MATSLIGNNRPAYVIMTGDDSPPEPIRLPSPVCILCEKPLPLTEEMCDEKVIGHSPPNGYVRLAESIPWDKVVRFCQATKENGYDDAYSDDAGRYVAWLDHLYWDLYRWKRRIVARVGSVLAPFRRISVIVIRTMPAEQPEWTEDVLVLQDGTRLYCVYVSPPGSESATLRKSSNRPPGRPQTRKDIIDAMRQMDPEDLRAMKQAQMAALFKAAESTCREHRKKVLGEGT
jgi:hypothetical protein